MAQNQSSNRLGALWVNKAKSEKGPALTGEIDGKRVAVFQNKKWSEDDDTSKQPRYHVLESTYKAKVQKA
jgi:hypothetical protein